MQDVNAVLREKEMALKKIRHEIEALRLVCHLLHDESDSTPDSNESGIEMTEVMPSLLPVADERQQSLAPIQERFLDARQEEPEKESGNVLVQFRELALNASRTIWKHVRDSRSEIQPRWKTFLDLFERPERSNAA